MIKILIQEFFTANGKDYALEFQIDDDSDFEITGGKSFFEKIGLGTQKISSEIKTGYGRILTA